MGSGRPLVAALTAAALITGCGGDDEPAASTLPSAPDTINFSSPDFGSGGAASFAGYVTYVLATRWATFRNFTTDPWHWF